MNEEHPVHKHNRKQGTSPMKIIRTSKEELALQKWIDIAVGQLDHLDPILACDLLWTCAVRPIDNGPLKVIYDECLGRANVHAPGTLRSAWNNVLDCLAEISHTTVKGGI